MGRPRLAGNFIAALLLISSSHSAVSPFVAAQTNVPINSQNQQFAKELYRQGRFTEAASLLRKLIKENKVDKESWYYLGLSLIESDQAKDATKAFESSLKLYPNFTKARIGLGYSFLLRNKPADALREVQAALTIEPSLAEGHYLIGVVRMNSGNAEDALAEAKEANRLNPQFPAAYLLRSKALLAKYAKNVARNLRILDVRSPEDRVDRLNRRTESAAVFKEAAASLETYLKLTPQDASSEMLREQLVSLKIYASDGIEKQSGGEEVFSGEEVTTKARVVEKPEPTYTLSARRSRVTGIVVIRAVFAADGTVQHILVLTGLPNGLTEQAVNAARRIKFIPAMKDGVPVSTAVQVEYGFNLYFR